MNSPVGQLFQFFQLLDEDVVEVLRGPQARFRNANAGSTERNFQFVIDAYADPRTYGMTAVVRF